MAANVYRAPTGWQTFYDLLPPPVLPRSRLPNSWMRTERQGEVKLCAGGLPARKCRPRVRTLGLLTSKTQVFFFVFNLLFIYLREERGRESTSGGGGAKGEGESRLLTEQEARCRAWAQDPETMICAEGRRLTNWVPQMPPEPKLLPLGQNGRVGDLLSNHSERKSVVSGRKREAAEGGVFRSGDIGYPVTSNTTSLNGQLMPQSPIPVAF